MSGRRTVIKRFLKVGLIATGTMAACFGAYAIGFTNDNARDWAGRN